MTEHNPNNCGCQLVLQGDLFFLQDVHAKNGPHACKDTDSTVWVTYAVHYIGNDVSCLRTTLTTVRDTLDEAKEDLLSLQANWWGVDRWEARRMDRKRPLWKEPS